MVEEKNCLESRSENLPKVRFRQRLMPWKRPGIFHNNFWFPWPSWGLPALSLRLNTAASGLAIGQNHCAGGVGQGVCGDSHGNAGSSYRPLPPSTILEIRLSRNKNTFRSLPWGKPWMRGRQRAFRRIGCCGHAVHCGVEKRQMDFKRQKVFHHQLPYIQLLGRHC